MFNFVNAFIKRNQLNKNIFVVSSPLRFLFVSKYNDGVAANPPPKANGLVETTIPIII
jgi:hypothetical protein